MVMQVQVDPGKKLQSALRKAGRLVEDLSLPLNLISEQWFKSNKAIFSLQSAGKYIDLSTKPFFAWWEKGALKREYPGGYKEYKEAKVGFVYPILKRLGTLEASITNPAHSNSVNRIINKKSLVLGSSVRYANFHQLGTSRMPARPVVIFGNEQRAPDALKRRVGQWEKIIMDYAVQVSGGKV